jgi:hypothetical protein
LAGRVKKKDGEKLTDVNIEKVIEGLQQSKPITKKAACQILNISYNPARLTKIIEEYTETKALRKRLRESKRVKAAEKHEITEVIVGYLDGRAVSDIAEGLYRPVSFVKGIVERVGVPQRISLDYFHPPVLPEQCIKEEFEVGEIVWSTRHQAPAIIRKEVPSKDYKCYQIYVIEEIEEESPYINLTGYAGRYAYQAVFDLGSLEHLKEYDIDIYKPYRSFFPTWLAGR